jgi:glycosyltransferase involved in cell wall biosynthesis
MNNLVIVLENFEYGGVSTHIEILLNNKNFFKKKIKIYTNQDNRALKKLKNKIKNPNVTFVKFKNFNCLFFKNKILKFFYHILRPFFFLISIIYFYQILKKFKNTILLANCGGYGNFRSEMAAIIAFFFLGNKCIYLLIHHAFTKPKLWNFLLQLINLIIYKAVKKIIFVSKATELNISHNIFFFKNKEKREIIYNGIKKLKIRKKIIPVLNYNKKYIKIGVLSRIEPVKGHAQIINAIDLLRDDLKKKIKVFFIGSGDSHYIYSLKKMINTKNLSEIFIFTGYIDLDSEQIIKNLNLVLSVNQEFEGFGYSHVEAASLGVPTFVTNVGAASEIFGKNSLNLIRPNDTNALKLKLEEFINNKAKFNKNTNTIKSIINRKFNEDLMVKKFNNILFMNEKFN